MNRNFFRTHYSENLKSSFLKYIQKDGYIYAVSKANDKLLLVIDDITNNKENFKKLGGSRAFDGVECIDFVDKGIMTKHTYNLDFDIHYIHNFTGVYDFYDKNRFDFTVEEVEFDKIISSLRKVFYFLQPTLQSRTLCGGGISNTVTDPNFYAGYYYLKNGEEYTILKHRNTVYFYTGNIPYNHILNKEEEKTGCIHKEEIDFELYSTAIRLQEIKRKINCHTSEMLDYEYEELKKLIEEYDSIKKELKQIDY